MTTSLGDGRLGLSTVAVNSNIIDYDEGTNKYEYVRVFEKNKHVIHPVEPCARD